MPKFVNATIEMADPKRFRLHRDVDVSGVSGTGYVASGVEWGDGTVALHWHTVVRSHAIYPSMDELEVLHGHDGTTKVEWLDA